MEEYRYDACAYNGNYERNDELIGCGTEGFVNIHAPLLIFY